MPSFKDEKFGSAVPPQRASLELQEASLTDGRDDVHFGAELVLVAAGDVADCATVANLGILRLADLAPHVTRVHEQNGRLRE